MTRPEAIAELAQQIMDAMDLKSTLQLCHETLRHNLEGAEDHKLTGDTITITG